MGLAVTFSASCVRNASTKHNTAAARPHLTMFVVTRRFRCRGVVGAGRIRRRRRRSPFGECGLGSKTRQGVFKIYSKSQDKEDQYVVRKFNSVRSRAFFSPSRARCARQSGHRPSAIQLSWALTNRRARRASVNATRMNAGRIFTSTRPRLRGSTRDGARVSDARVRAVAQSSGTQTSPRAALKIDPVRPFRGTVGLHARRTRLAS